MKQIHFNNASMTKWAGGTTTELFIYPKEATYPERNFDFRLSTATVEIETSVFTPLPEINRTLMVLEGEMKLTHTDQHEITLKPFETDDFNGGWETKSLGKCVDLNLMCRGKTSGKLTHIELLHQDVINFNLNAQLNLIYVYRGTVLINHMAAITGDLIILDGEGLQGAVGADACDMILIEMDNVPNLK